MEQLFLKYWKLVPPRLFGLIGATACFLYLYDHIDSYEYYWQGLEHLTINQAAQLTRLALVDLTITIMGISFFMRRPAVAGPNQGREIQIALLGSAWPLLPFVFDGLLAVLNPELRAQWKPFFMEQSPGDIRLTLGISLMIIGLSIDVWGYAALFRSFSLVPEARELITKGPYRFVRHPVYFGQFLAQAGLWLCFATFHGGWVVWYIIFLHLQFLRIRNEEAILEDAFGQQYRNFKDKVYWMSWPFVR